MKIKIVYALENLENYKPTVLIELKKALSALLPSEQKLRESCLIRLNNRKDDENG